MSAGRRLTGPAGTADEVLFEPTGNPDHSAHIGTWLLHCPGQSPAWEHYALMAVHLRPLPGESRPARINVPGATHEFLLCAIDPARTPSAADPPGSWSFLRPFNVWEQVDLPADAAAAELLELCARAVLAGVLPAEPALAGAVEPWHTSLLRSAAHYRGEAHASGDLDDGGVVVAATAATAATTADMAARTWPPPPTVSQPRRSVSEVRLNDAVMVLSGTIPVGGRIVDLGDGERPWVDICVLGQHLPQMYRLVEIEALDAASAEALGLCGTCLGYGTTGPPVPPATSFDQLVDPCPTCTGTGRPAIRLTMVRDGPNVSLLIGAVRHEARVGPEYAFCLACGMHPDDPTANHGPPE